MNGDQYIVFAGDGRWRAARVSEGSATVRGIDFDAQAELDARADAVRDSLAELGHLGHPVMLAIASSWCLCAAISTEDLPRGKRHEAMAYRLEEHLPISAEDVVADYVRTAPGEALGVCSERHRLETIVEALTQRGVPVRHVCPEALLVAAHVAGVRGGADCVLVGRDRAEGDADSNHGMDLVELRGGKCVGWLWLADDESAVGEHLAMLAEDRREPLRLATAGGGLDALESMPTGEAMEWVRDNGMDVDHAAGIWAERILADVAGPWVDLRCGAMATGGAGDALRKPLAALAVAAALALLCVCGIFLWRGQSYAAMADQSRRDQVGVFRETLPNQRVPRVGILGRLRSERQRRAVLGGQVDIVTPGSVPRPSALMQLHDVLAGLPNGLRYRVMYLSCQPDLVRMEGEARSYADVDKLAAALRGATAYEVDPAKMQTLKKGGVSFIFTARPGEGPLLAKETR